MEASNLTNEELLKLLDKSPCKVEGHRMVDWVSEGPTVHHTVGETTIGYCLACQREQAAREQGYSKGHEKGLSDACHTVGYLVDVKDAEARGEAKGRLEEAKWWEHLAGNHCNSGDCVYCERIEKLTDELAALADKK